MASVARAMRGLIPRRQCAQAARGLASRERRMTGGGGVGAKGRVAGGEALGSTAAGAPRKPKVFSFSVPGAPGQEEALSEAQRREVDEHNREFERTHGGEGERPERKVDERFWNGKGTEKKKGEQGKE
ncbi:uncharacterized protein MAM_03387 [Metarhizium album ARSEF 1941]|uniref:Uncharacterized protein n=1 Tax=Metarhizium album (strain ARSEF 1941) TaxID=1081103 RepID=A0A0B2X1F9_METAS|nr:uncharacterized protein MAM_03387 [Metarhizium album ARSEF 1941]KHN98925.1 hypothetical protein MAM_03387 [Metarhizium album ARSEF 1941]